MQFYRPGCFAEVAADERDTPCRVCGARIEEWERRDYTERLIHALGHPNPEVHMGAIISLGNRRDPRAALPLAECALAHPVDVVQALAVVRALHAIPLAPERDMALDMLATHPARTVRRAVARLRSEPKYYSDHGNLCYNFPATAYISSKKTAVSFD
ncbi:MAG: HEAT repeat domain-containing protein [Roseiflexus sp.]|nr:HEAT repeat domain-containing protein [Roseiflexus sp.]MBO9341428.1 HEAT repeat domain-containing protein [Roseiflexus sp.]MBO9382859.1 HEAT repeat domain-containing protein [Roseiflexus sp.]